LPLSNYCSSGREHHTRPLAGRKSGFRAGHVANSSFAMTETITEFGKSLSGITRSITDRMVDAAAQVSNVVIKSAELPSEAVRSVTVSVKKKVTLAASSGMATPCTATNYVRGSNKKE
jgi:hypothetical protein